MSPIKKSEKWDETLRHCHFLAESFFTTLQARKK